MFIILIIALIVFVVIGGIISFVLYAFSSFISFFFAGKDEVQTRSFIQSGLLAVFTLAFLIGSANSCSHGDALKREAMKASNLNYTVGGEWNLLGLLMLVTGGICGCIAIWCIVSGSNSENSALDSGKFQNINSEPTDFRLRGTSSDSPNRKTVERKVKKYDF